MQLRIIYKSLANTVRNDNEAIQHYVNCNFGNSRRFIKAVAHMPFLNEGIIWLTRFQTSAWWTSKRRHDFLKAAGEDYSHLPEEQYALCKNNFENNTLKIHHILFHCPIWKKERKQWLCSQLNLLQDIMAQGRGHTPPADPQLMEGEITATLLGGGFYMDGYDDGIYTAFPDWQGSKNPAQAFILYEKEWGGQNEYYTPHMTMHSYVPVAMYLAAVMPKHKACLFRERRGMEHTIRYTSLPAEKERHNRCIKWINELCHEDLDDGNEFALTREPHIIKPTQREFHQIDVLKKDMIQMFKDASDCSTKSDMQEETGSDHDEMVP